MHTSVSAEFVVIPYKQFDKGLKRKYFATGTRSNSRTENQKLENFQNKAFFRFNPILNDLTKSKVKVPFNLDAELLQFKPGIKPNKINRFN